MLRSPAPSGSREAGVPWRAQPHVLSTTPSPSLSGTTSCCGPGTRNATLTLGSASAKHRGVREQAGRAEPVQARAAGTPSAQPGMSKLFSLRAEGIAARLAAASRKRRASATRGTLRLRRSSHDAVTAAFHATRHSTRCAVPAPARCCLRVNPGLSLDTLSAPAVDERQEPHSAASPLLLPRVEAGEADGHDSGVEGTRADRPGRSLRIRPDLETRAIGGPVFDVISNPRTGS